MSQFVGRERELAALVEALEQVESGQGQVVGIVAEAGGGKSRLLYEFRQRLAGRRVTYLEGRCLSYGHAMPYHPIIDLLRNNCGITDTDSPEAIAEKVQGALHEVGMDVEASAPYLLQLLGVKEGTERLAALTPEAIKTRTFETLRQMSLHGSQQRPLVFEIEDLHWCDNTSEDYLALAGGECRRGCDLVAGHVSSRLSTAVARQVVCHPDGAAPSGPAGECDRGALDPSAPRVTRASGADDYRESGGQSLLPRRADPCRARPRRRRDDVTVPETIQGVLMARIDRLPEAPKRLLQTAAVLGRAFSPPLLEAIWDGTRPLAPLLLDLTRQEFLFERTGAEGPMYVFKHALTQEVAYESLLTTRRQALHTAAGQALETLYAPRLEDAYDRLAYHYARTDNVAKAVAYLTRVAEKAARNSAHVEAIAHLTTGAGAAADAACHARAQPARTAVAHRLGGVADCHQRLCGA